MPNIVMNCKYNIYKIKNEYFESLLTKLNTDSTLKNISNKQGWYFFINETPDPIDIWWVDQFSFFTDRQDFQNTVHKGCIIRKLDDQNIFAIPFGHFYHKLIGICESDFGINLAERILLESEIKNITSKFTKSKKNSVIQKYSDYTTLDVEVGESIYQISGKTKDKKIWGETVRAGSSIVFNIQLEPQDLDSFFEKIVEELKKDASFVLPRSTEVKDEKIIQDLDQKLVDNLKHSEIDFEDNSFGNVDFAKNSNYEKYKFYTGKQPKTRNLDDKDYYDITTESFRHFLTQSNLKLTTVNIRSIRVFIKTDTSSNYSKNLINHIDATIDNYTLIDGKWMEFNDKYIDYLNERLKDIKINNRFDNISTRLDQVEDLINKGVASEFNFSNSDKYLLPFGKDSIEISDLYDKANKEIIHVKKGSPQKLNYVLSQARASIVYLKDNNNQWQLKKNNMVIETGLVECISLFLVLNRSKISSFSDVKSILFKKGLIDLVRECEMAKLKYKVYVGYSD